MKNRYLKQIAALGLSVMVAMSSGMVDVRAMEVTADHTETEAVTEALYEEAATETEPETEAYSDMAENGQASAEAETEAGSEAEETATEKEEVTEAETETEAVTETETETEATESVEATETEKTIKETKAVKEVKKAKLSESEQEEELPMAAEAEEEDATGANESISWFGKKVTAKTITVKADKSGKKDTWKEIQQVLNDARDNATDSKPYKIIIPAGSYKISQSLHIYSNTYLYMKGATINKCFTVGCMLRNGVVADVMTGYDGARNIYLEGGTWNGNGKDKTYGLKKAKPFSNIRIGHAKNVVFDTVTIKDNVSSHHVEFGGVDGVTVKNCTFSGQVNYVDETTNEYNGNESLQIDVVHSEDVFSDFKKYDDAITKNVTITGCTFENVFRGVGSHSGILGTYYTNIKIKNNTFKNINQQAIIATNYKNSEISGNTMINVGAGVEFKYMTQGGTSFHKPVSGGSYKIDPNCQCTIANNTITTYYTPEYPTPEGIRVMGWNITKKSGEVPAGNYNISGLTLTNNTIKSNGFGIRLIDVTNSTISNNNISFQKDLNGKQITNCKDYSGKKQVPNGIVISQGSKKLKVSTNTINNAPDNGILVTEKSTGNTFTANKINNAKGCGIQIYDGSTGNEISGKNVISKAGTVGIQVSTKSSATISKNEIKNSGAQAVNIYKDSSATVSGNTITAPKTGGVQISTGSKATVKSNKITGSKAEGIKVYKNSQGTIESNTIKKSGSNGIAISSGSKNVTVKKNAISDSKKSGISVYDASKTKITLDSNKISSSKENGILINKKSCASVQKNTITSSKKNGICVVAATGTVTIKSNKITGSAGHGIDATKSTVKIEKNTITGSKKYGISLSNGGTVKSMKNNVLSNKGIREILVAANVKSSVKSLDEVKVDPVKKSSKKVTGKATVKNTIIVTSGKKQIGKKKLGGKCWYTVKIAKQKAGTSLKVSAVDAYNNSAYRMVKVK